MRAIYWFIRRWLFIVRHCAMGDSLLEAQYRWTLLMMEKATLQTLRRSMGRFAIRLGFDKRIITRIFGRVK